MSEQHRKVKKENPLNPKINLNRPEPVIFPYTRIHISKAHFPLQTRYTFPKQSLCRKTKEKPKEIQKKQHHDVDAEWIIRLFISTASHCVRAFSRRRVKKFHHFFFISTFCTRPDLIKVVASRMQTSRPKPKHRHTHTKKEKNTGKRGRRRKK